MTMINDLTDIYHRPSSTRQSSKTSSTIFVVSETSSPAKPINVYLYASIGVIVIIVLFLILASAVLISMYIWFKQAIVNDSSCMEAVAPSTSSAPWSVFIACMCCIGILYSTLFIHFIYLYLGIVMTCILHVFVKYNCYILS